MPLVRGEEKPGGVAPRSGPGVGNDRVTYYFLRGR